MINIQYQEDNKIVLKDCTDCTIEIVNANDCKINIINSNVRINADIDTEGTFTYSLKPNVLEWLNEGKKKGVPLLEARSETLLIGARSNI